MSFLEPKTIPLFYFTGEKATTPTCPVEMQPNLNPSSGAQSYQNADAGCTRSAKYNIPFFLENLGPTFSEWSVNAHEARPGHHTQVMPVLSLDWLSCVGCFPFCQTKQSDNSGIIQEKKKATAFDWTKFPIELTRVAFRPKYWLLLSKLGRWKRERLEMERQILGELVKKDHILGNGPLWPENFHVDRSFPYLFLNWDFRKFWHNGKHTLLLVGTRTLSISLS